MIDVQMKALLVSLGAWPPWRLDEQGRVLRPVFVVGTGRIEWLAEAAP